MPFEIIRNDITTVLTITDMECSMCEAHINEAVRKAFKVKKVKSSHKKNETLIVSDEPLDDDEIRRVISETGYTLTEITRK